jgi:hypothetical protein
MIIDNNISSAKLASEEISSGYFKSLAVSNGKAYMLADGGTKLMVFDLSDLSSFTTVELSGDAASLTSLDFRPATGDLLGYDDATDSYFTVDVMTGASTLVSSALVTLTDTINGDIDWNPTIDRMRTVTETDQNIVFNPDTGDASNAATTPLFYAVGDMNEGVDPMVTGNAYTNSVAGAVTTQQFGESLIKQ